jgi:hypothetical protein
MTSNSRLTLVRFGIWSVRVDREATRRAYAQCSGRATPCDCAPCRNFAAAREHIFPDSVVALFRDLGIDPRCPAEVYSQGRDKNGLHRYGGWFHLVGELEAEIDNIESVGEDFMLWLTRHLALVPAAFENSSVVQLEFVAGVPWVIDEPQPD